MNVLEEKQPSKFSRTAINKYVVHLIVSEDWSGDCRQIVGGFSAWFLSEDKFAFVCAAAVKNKSRDVMSGAAASIFVTFWYLSVNKRVLV